MHRIRFGHRTIDLSVFFAAGKLKRIDTDSGSLLVLSLLGRGARNRVARFEREARAGLVEMNVSSAGWGCPENQPVHAHRILARRTTAGDLRSG